MDSHACAWAAGFWDGEGCTYALRRKNGSIDTPTFKLSQSGPEAVVLLERFQAAVGIAGKIYQRTDARTNYLRHSAYQLVIGGAEPVRGLLAHCRPWLSRAKIAQAETAIRTWEDYRAAFVHRNSLKTECPYGHPYDAANTYTQRDGRRRCRACRIRMYNADKERARSLERARYHAKKHPTDPLAPAAPPPSPPASSLPEKPAMRTSVP